MACDFHTHDPEAENALISSTHPLADKTTSLEVHPWKINADFVLDRAALAASLRECAALGEVGYDPLRGDAKRQLEVLPELLGLALELKKPVVLHLVRPTETVFGILARYPLRYLVHGFRGKAEKLASYLGRGWFVSLGSRTLADPGVAEYLKNRGLERIGFETDASGEDLRAVLTAAASALDRPDLEQVTDRNFDEFLFGSNRSDRSDRPEKTTKSTTEHNGA